jgi:transposase
MGAVRKYPGELRDRPVRLVLDQETSVMVACRTIGQELGINADTLRGWVKEAQVRQGLRPGNAQADVARIRTLEKENAELRRANAILRTASAFSRPNSATGKPGGGLRGGRPGRVRSRAGHQGAVSGCTSGICPPAGRRGYGVPLRAKTVVRGERLEVCSRKTSTN